MSEEELSDDEVFDEMSNNGILGDSMDESGSLERVSYAFFLSEINIFSICLHIWIEIGFDNNDAFSIFIDEKDKRKAYEVEFYVQSIADIRHDQNNHIKHISGMFGIPEEQSAMLLRYFRWNKERLIEQYMDNPDAVLQVVGITIDVSTTPALKTVPGFICEICCEDERNLQTYALQCGHRYCRYCYEHYLTQKIKEEGESCRIYCPGEKCKFVVTERVIELLVSPEISRRYIALLDRTYVNDNEHLRYCPAPNCEYTIKCKIEQRQLTSIVPTVVCLCGQRFCFGCGLSDHQPCICILVKMWLKKCEDDSETANWISANTKKCPKCNATIEKNGGCNHMICKKCKYEFCWVCIGPWSEHGTNWYNCNRYDEKSKIDFRDQQAQSRALLERYLHYYNRFSNHEQSAKLDRELYLRTEKKMAQLQITSDMSWIEVQFLRRAVDILCQCRQTLKWTYAFSFYLARNNATEIFEDNQRDLEMAVESLSGLCQRPINVDQISQLKQAVLDKTVYVGLIPLLKSIQVKTHIKQYSGKTIGVDAYIWLYKGAFSCASDLALGISTKRYINYAMHQVKMLKHYGIKMFIVFDGDYLPGKAGTENKRGKKREENKAKGLEFLAQNKKRLAIEQFQKCINVTPEMAYEFIKELKRENIDYIVAPYEADAQLAYLEKQGIIDAILTEDSDLLVFGCKCILLKLNQYGECIEIKREKFPQIKEIDLSGWTDENFRYMAILSGCDYLESIRGIGLKTAYRLLKKHKTIDQLLKALRTEYSLEVPSDYETQFNFANLTFMHQRVYCLDKKSIIMWNEPGIPLGDNVDRIVGPNIPSDIVQDLIRGEINPITKLPISVSLNKIQMHNQTKENIQVIFQPSKQEKNIPLNNYITSFFESSRINNSQSQILSVLNNNTKRSLINDIPEQTITKRLKDSTSLNGIVPLLKVNQNNHLTQPTPNENNFSEFKKKTFFCGVEKSSQTKTSENSMKKINQKNIEKNTNNSNNFQSSQTIENSGSRILNKCPWFDNVSSEKGDTCSNSSRINIFEDKEPYNNLISSWYKLYSYNSKNSTSHLPLSEIATQNTILTPITEPITEYKMPKDMLHARKLPSTFKLPTNKHYIES
ncbi:hypothetical protein PCANB_001240 [Pneumocystis canis]|nr:hypothetical protein PCANB_001240 [Pneumocystis canis]